MRWTKAAGKSIRPAVLAREGGGQPETPRLAANLTARVIATATRAASGRLPHSHIHRAENQLRWTKAAGKLIRPAVLAREGGGQTPRPAANPTAQVMATVMRAAGGRPLRGRRAENQLRWTKAAGKLIRPGVLAREGGGQTPRPAANPTCSGGDSDSDESRQRTAAPWP